ncbi:hypothetical protein KP509_14G036200 [Ceratopteris richardii]|uniref:Uncharacterized protein n=1 Tax=Ceratopteris richardii TaxID=49495 RepID=A0A8T2T8K5_CERRI|nr:hypothetical protein KP509_14G036200 [Ceratopteris richardii]
MSCAPGIFIFGRRAKRNPYADRGLAQFALLSAELESVRKKLLIELGTQLSLIRFESLSDQSKWVPIIICPTLPRSQVRALRQAVTEIKPENRYASRSPIKQLCQANNNTYVQAENDNFERQGTSAANPTEHTGKSDNKNEAGSWNLAHIANTAEKLLWMTAFGLSVLADMIQSFLKLRASTGISSRSGANLPRKSVSTKPNLPSGARSGHPPPLPSTNLQKTQRVAAKHHHTPGRQEIPSKSVTQKHKESPASPSKLRTAYHSCLSLPKPSVAENVGICTQGKLRSSISLPKTTSFQDAAPPAVGQPAATEKESSVDIEQQTDKWEKGLGGVGLVLGLSGLFMGYVPAIASVVCWWYLLPSLRNALGIKPIVRSHHHHHRHEVKS